MIARLLVAAGLLMLCSPGVAAAQERWVPLETTLEDRAVAVDSETVLRDGSVLLVWLRLADYSGEGFTLVHRELDCRGRRWRADEMVRVDDQGRRSPVPLGADDRTLRFLPPDSDAERLLVELCGRTEGDEGPSASVRGPESLF